VIGWEITKVQFVKTADSVFIPKALKLLFMRGTIGILYGRSDMKGVKSLLDSSF
jgi:hypothetical protein